MLIVKVMSDRHLFRLGVGGFPILLSLDVSGILRIACVLFFSSFSLSMDINTIFQKN